MADINIIYIYENGNNKVNSRVVHFLKNTYAHNALITDDINRAGNFIKDDMKNFIIYSMTIRHLEKNCSFINSLPKQVCQTYIFDHLSLDKIKKNILSRFDYIFINESESKILSAIEHIVLDHIPS